MAQMYYPDRSRNRALMIALVMIGIIAAAFIIYAMSDRNTESPTLNSPASTRMNAPVPNSPVTPSPVR